jgi:hypothetical protein
MTPGTTKTFNHDQLTTLARRIAVTASIMVCDNPEVGVIVGGSESRVRPQDKLEEIIYGVVSAMLGVE